MISPEEIKQQALRWWPQVLEGHIRGETFSPRIIDRIGKIRSSDVRQQFDKVQNEIESLLRHSKNETGIGYLVEKSDYNFRRSGNHELPKRIVIVSLDDYLHVTHKKREWTLFIKNVELTTSVIPRLKEWAQSNTSWLIKSDIDWEGILHVCQYFLSTPRPELYVRQLPVAVHTKFIEENTALLQSLLDFLISDHIRDSRQKRFAERYYLKYDEPTIRIRILDEALSFQYNLKDLSVPLSSFLSLNLDCTHILITENKMNFLSLPDMPLTIALWSGGGFNVSYLKNVDWLINKQIYYWGDIDEHGFQILHQLRSYYSFVKSFLMNVETYKAYQKFAISTKVAHIDNLFLLNEDEKETLNTIQSNPHKNRLEQERISHQDVKDAIKKVIYLT